MTKCEQGPGPCVLLTRDELKAYKALTIQDRIEMVDPEERAEIERQAIDAFVDDLAEVIRREAYATASTTTAARLTRDLERLERLRKKWTGK